MRSISGQLLASAFVLALSACASSPEPLAPPSETESIEDSTVSDDLRPQNGIPVFLGVSNRQRDRDQEEAEAIRHVAEQASRYVRTSAIYQYVSQRGTDGIGYLDDIITDWDEQAADELVDSVEVLSARRTEAATIITARVSGLPPAPPMDHISLAGDGDVAPRWVSSTPEVPGYLVAVGTAQRRRTLRDTIDATDEEALKAILIQTGSTLRMVEDRRSVERRGTTGTVTSAEEARATLSGFQVVARYMTSNGRYHYSLAVAREE